MFYTKYNATGEYIVQKKYIEKFTDITPPQVSTPPSEYYNPSVSTIPQVSTPPSEYYNPSVSTTPQVSTPPSEYYNPSVSTTPQVSTHPPEYYNPQVSTTPQVSTPLYEYYNPSVFTTPQVSTPPYEYYNPSVFTTPQVYTGTIPVVYTSIHNNNIEDLYIKNIIKQFSLPPFNKIHKHNAIISYFYNMPSDKVKLNELNKILLSTGKFLNDNPEIIRIINDLLDSATPSQLIIKLFIILKKILNSFNNKHIFNITDHDLTKYKNEMTKYEKEINKYVNSLKK